MPRPPQQPPQPPQPPQQPQRGKHPDPTPAGQPHRTFRRGARPSPRHMLLAATPFVPTVAPPAQLAYVPAVLRMWGNDTHGDCVSAEEAYAKDAMTPQVTLTDQEVVAWATQHDYLEGATLTDVMDSMQVDGMVDAGTEYRDGEYLAVDYSDESTLQAAIAAGVVKLGIDGDALPPKAGNVQGWSATGGTPGQFSSEDHCVSLTGYGPATWLYSQLGLPVPSGVDPASSGYLVYTWSTIGYVDHEWIMSTCAEAWVRQPTTVVPGPTPTPTPTPTPGPTPTPTPTPTPPGPSPVCQALEAWIASLAEEAAGHPYLLLLVQYLEAQVRRVCGGQPAQTMREHCDSVDPAGDWARGGRGR